MSQLMDEGLAIGTPLCVVCIEPVFLLDPAKGDGLLVFHPTLDEACGCWIHSTCQYEPGQVCEHGYPAVGGVDPADVVMDGPDEDNEDEEAEGDEEDDEGVPAESAVDIVRFVDEVEQDDLPYTDSLDWYSRHESLVIEQVQADVAQEDHDDRLAAPAQPALDDSGSHDHLGDPTDQEHSAHTYVEPNRPYFDTPDWHSRNETWTIPGVQDDVAQQLYEERLSGPAQPALDNSVEHSRPVQEIA